MTTKHEYLDLLAQYKLCDRFKEQTAEFLVGLHRVVPDSLLSLFDEPELPEGRVEPDRPKLHNPGIWQIRGIQPESACEHADN